MESTDTEILHAGDRNVKNPLEYLKDNKENQSEKIREELHELNDLKRDSISLTNFAKKIGRLDGKKDSKLSTLGMFALQRLAIIKEISIMLKDPQTKRCFDNNLAPKSLVDLYHKLELLDSDMIPEYITFAEFMIMAYDGCKDLISESAQTAIATGFTEKFDVMSEKRVAQIEKAIGLNKEMMLDMIKQNKDMIMVMVDNYKKLFDESVKNSNETIKSMQVSINDLEMKALQSQKAPTFHNNNGAKADTVKDIAQPEPAMNTQVDVLKTAFGIEKQAMQDKIARLEAMTAATAPTTEKRLDAEAAAMQSMVSTPAPAQNPDIVPTGNEFVDAKRQEPDRMEKVKKIIKDSYDKTGNFRIMTSAEIKNFFLTKEEKKEIKRYKFDLEE